ncbi:MAG: hypothetical protein ABIQ32_07800 [Sphingomicrobium sp.]
MVTVANLTNPDRLPARSRLWIVLLLGAASWAVVLGAAAAVDRAIG